MQQWFIHHTKIPSTMTCAKQVLWAEVVGMDGMNVKWKQMHVKEVRVSLEEGIGGGGGGSLKEKQ